MKTQDDDKPPLFLLFLVMGITLLLLLILSLTQKQPEMKLLPDIGLEDCFIRQPSVPVRPTDKSLASLTGIPELDRIFLCESTNNYLAQNPKSSAWGFCQMIKSTRKYVESQIGKIDWQSPEEQIRACIWLYKNSCPEREWEESKKCWKVLDN